MAGKFSIEAIFSGKDGLSRLVSRMAGATHGAFSRMGSGLAKLDERMSRMVASSGRAALALGAIGVATGGALAFVGQAGLDFEEAISAVGAVSLKTRGEIADLEAEAIRLGATTKFSATEVAQAMETMGRAGFENAEVLAGIPGILAATAAEGGEIAEIAGHVSNVLKGMGLATTETDRVADVLTLASAKTNSSISSLGESMKNLAPVARQMGVPLEQAVASVALLQDVGLDASEAGTATATMLTQLAKPMDRVAARMTELGIAFKDAHGNTLPFTDILANFDKAAKKAGGSMDVIAFFADLVGLRGQKAALNLKEAFASGTFAGLVTELDSAAGSAEKMATLRMNNLKGDLETLGGAVDSLKIALFNTESGALRGIVRGMGEWIDANTELITMGFVQFMEDARFAADAFGAGMREGFGATVGAIESIFGPLTRFAGIMDSGRSWPENVRLLGQAFGFLTVATAGFLAFTAAVRLARGALFAYQLMVGIARGAVWLFNAALVAGRTASLLYTVAWLYWQRVGQTSIGTTVGLRLATIANTVATKASALWTGITTLALKAWNLVAGTSIGRLATLTGATYAQAGASVASARASMVAATGLKAVALAAGAAMAAIAAVMVAWDQWKKLEKESGGFEGVKAGVDSFFKGDGFFKGVDEHLNAQARAKFEAEKRSKLEQSNVVDTAATSLGRFGANAQDPAQLDNLLAQLQAGTMLGGPGLGAGDTADVEAAAQAAAREIQPQVVDTTSESIKRSVHELVTTTTEKSELVIKDETGRAELTHKKGEGKRIKLDQSGAFNG